MPPGERPTRRVSSTRIYAAWSAGHDFGKDTASPRGPRSIDSIAFAERAVGMQRFLLKFLVVWALAVVLPLAVFEWNAAVRKLLLSPEYILTIGFVLFVGLRIEESYKKRKDGEEADIFEEEAGDEIKTESSLKYKDLKVGHGKEAKSGDKAVIHYTGWLTDGTKFDSSRGRKGIWELLLEWQPHSFSSVPRAKTYGSIFDRDRREPFSFWIDNDDVIQGWHQGVPGMRVDGKRRLIVPPELGSGAEGKGTIPANAKLVFVVELVDILEKEKRTA